ncbi:PP2C family protein-serine/threonine phosphatase [Saccharothrix algeriensis]|uniref:Methionine-R-sulfoxide reductase with GAF domain n=1 Tax=Saccharothrix algeriensis TaxID=173560 RepID=A0A8T8HXH3_9PSEU|nr:GAF domain-containing SpoIIE family protein phosphatase [Saccharothrix algeriensis]MBM7814827.1 putative methionine-R-sulfoxide reductase with GAF domain [Saccharothrix algeriensis]QTR03101.1 SpoIIE family protein phosphatase [Saccharothrix algeriensis]
MGVARNSELRLRVFEAVTDAALRDLEPEKLFEVMLWQVHELFAVDTATVLLADARGEQVVASAAVGLEEEVHQGFRVPVGTGFAGQVAQERKPVRIDHVDQSTVVNPLLWERGLLALLGVPMVAQGDLVGVLHVGATVARRFTDEEVELLQMVADRLAMAVHVHRSRAERSAAAMLQDSLLPGLLPTPEGWELAARYVPGAGNGVGGDWYDVFDLPGGRIGLVIGDVVGNGLPAAIVMGRLRSALRAYALEFDDPAVVLGKLDRKADHFEHHTMATVAYAVVDTATHRMDLALAGHLPPVLAEPGRAGRYVDAPVDPPIGYSLAATGRRGAVVDVPPGALVALYTDGLVERRGQDLDDGLERLRRVVSPTAPEDACARIMSCLVGDRPAADDIALVTIRHTPGPDRPDERAR